MDGFIVHAGIGMARGSLARIEDGKGMAVHVLEGEVYVTEEGDPRDYFVQPGSCFRIQRERLTLVYALRRSLVTLTAPVPAQYARRIDLLMPRTSEARLIYDRRLDSGGWVEAMRHRLTRAWTTS